eukprot:COSAG01_NODE_924_length_12710_cov_10.895567_7_plen_190_part_00
MAMRLGDDFPNIEADSTIGPLRIHEYWGDGWGILFSHPGDFTPVCTTELGTVQKFAILPPLLTRPHGSETLLCRALSRPPHASSPGGRVGCIQPAVGRCLLNGVRRRYIEEFTKRGVKLCAISCDPVSEHVEWSKDICSSQGCAEVSFPILADQDREIVTELGMIGALGGGAAQRHGRTRRRGGGERWR